MCENNLYIKRKETEGIIWSVLASFGYKDIEPTLVKDGKIILPTDMRKAVTDSCRKEEYVKRYCAAGIVYNEEKGSICERGEYAAELVGADTACACAEPIAVAAETLIALGIEDFYIKIGSNTFVKALCKATGKDFETLLCAIKNDNAAELEKLLSDYDGELKPLILNIKNIMGDTCILDNIEDVKLPKEAQDTIAQLCEIYTLTVLYGFEKFPIIDLGLVGDDEYNDMFFEVYISNSDKPIAKGGVREALGKRCAGVVFYTDALAELTKGAGEEVSKTLIFPEKAAFGIAYDVAYNLRVNGCLVEGYVGNGGYKEAEKYAKKTNAECMLRVFSDGKLQIKDFKRGDITETTVDDFLGYYDEHEEEEDCCCGDDCHHHHHEH